MKAIEVAQFSCRFGDARLSGASNLKGQAVTGPRKTDFQT